MTATSIEWTDWSVNPIRARNIRTGAVGHYCELKSSGCANCYASRLQRRFQMPTFGGKTMGRSAEVVESIAGPGGGVASGTPCVRVSPELEVFLDEGVLRQVLRRCKPTTIFWCDMTDLFGWWVPFEWIDRIMAVCALTPQHTHQILTKRPERMAEYLNTLDRAKAVLGAGRDAVCKGDVSAQFEAWIQNIISHHVPVKWPLPNVWLGPASRTRPRPMSASRACCAAPRPSGFCRASRCWGRWICAGFRTRRRRCWGAPGGAPSRRVDWVIVGGESGPHARPCDVAWIRSIVGQCRAAGVPVFVKQLGRRILIPNDSFDDWPRGGDGLISVGNSERPHYQGQPCEVRTVDPKGGDPAEWPALLDVREFPKSASHPDAGGTPAPQIPKG